MKFITKPCETCGDPVKDRDDPNFKEKWRCYYCHCLETGRDPKTALNTLADAMKTGSLVFLDPTLKPS